MNYDEMIAVIQAAKEGKEIEYRSKNEHGNFVPATTPVWNFHYYDYRIKPEPTREELTAAWVKKHGIVVGSKVKVVKKFESTYLSWNTRMDKEIDKIGVVSSINNSSISVGIWSYLIESLEPVKDEYIPYAWEDRDEFRGKWARWKDNQKEFVINCIAETGLVISDVVYYWEELFKKLEFIDVTPFGKKI